MTIWAIEARYPADMPEVLSVDATKAIAASNLHDRQLRRR